MPPIMTGYGAPAFMEALRIFSPTYWMEQLWLLFGWFVQNLPNLLFYWPIEILVEIYLLMIAKVISKFRPA